MTGGRSIRRVGSHLSVVSQLWRYLGDLPHDTPGNNDLINDGIFKIEVQLICLDCGQSCFPDDAQRDHLRSSPCLRGWPYSETLELGDSGEASPSSEVEELVNELVDSLDYTYDELLAEVERLHSYHLPLEEIERALKFQDERR